MNSSFRGGFEKRSFFAGLAAKVPGALGWVAKNPMKSLGIGFAGLEGVNVAQKAARAAKSVRGGVPTLGGSALPKMPRLPGT